MTVRAAPSLILNGVCSGNKLTTRFWTTAIWERRADETTYVGSASFEYRWGFQVRGKLECPAMGVAWTLRTEGEQLTWYDQEGTLVGRVICRPPNSFRKQQVVVQDAASKELFRFEAPRWVYTEGSRPNEFTQVHSPGGRFEVCIFPAIGYPDFPNPLPGLLDDLTLWILRPKDEARSGPKEKLLTAKGKLDQIIPNKVNKRYNCLALRRTLCFNGQA